MILLILILLIVFGFGGWYGGNRVNPGLRDVKAVPVWLLGVLIGLGSIGLTLVFDRVAIAESQSSISVRVDALERQYDELRKADERTLAHLESNSEKLDALTISVQKVIDRQEEVRRKLRLNE